MATPSFPATQDITGMTVDVRDVDGVFTAFVCYETDRKKAPSPYGTFTSSRIAETLRRLALELEKRE